MQKASDVSSGYICPRPAAYSMPEPHLPCRRREPAGAAYSVLSSSRFASSASRMSSYVTNACIPAHRPCFRNFRSRASRFWRACAPVFQRAVDKIAELSKGILHRSHRTHADSRVRVRVCSLTLLLDNPSPINSAVAYATNHALDRFGVPGDLDALCCGRGS
jgi:hypothetical protein